jgi:hypothetical protein
MSSQLPASEQHERVRSIAAYCAAERLPFEYFTEQTADFGQVGSREKLEAYRIAIGVNPVTGVADQSEAFEAARLLEGVNKRGPEDRGVQRR